MQLTMFGTSQKKVGAFRIYHDESGTDSAHSRFQLHGALIIPVENADWIYASLAKAREGYSGRIHFVQLRDNSSSRKGAVSSSWLQLFFVCLLDHCFYKCMIVDTGSPYFDASKYSERYHLYNFAACTAIIAGITWSLKNFDEVSLSLFSENLSRQPNDNFVNYLPCSVAMKLNKKNQAGKKCPRIVEPVPPVVLVSGDPGKMIPELAQHCEFIQLTDLITSAIGQAVNAGAQQRIKLNLASLVAEWIQDVRKAPWLQKMGLHRKFSVSCFPDRNGEFYNVPLGLSQKGMNKLFP